MLSPFAAWRALRAWLETEPEVKPMPNNYTSVHRLPVMVWDGHNHVARYVDVAIDLDSVARQLGSKALNAKSKTSRAINGAIKVRAA